MDPKETNLFDSIRRTLKLNTDWLAWYLNSIADVKGKKSWLIYPPGVTDTEGRICVVSHIDTVHDGIRSGFVKRHFVSNGGLTVKSEVVARASRLDPVHRQGKPAKDATLDYFRMVNKDSFDCVISKRGEWRRPSEGGEWTFFKGWGNDIGDVVITFACRRGVYIRDEIKQVSNKKRTPKSRVSGDNMATTKTVEQSGEWEESIVEPKKHRKALILYDPKHQVFWSPDGLGGDDRIGVWAAFKMLRDAPDDRKPVLLFCDYEESGGQGAKEAAEAMKDILSKVKCFIEFDRRGYNDAVFYNDEPEEWKKVWKKRKFEVAGGSYSDVATLGRAVDICTVNLSCGYVSQHTKTEHAFKEVAVNNVKVALDAWDDIYSKKQWHNRKRVVTKALDRRSSHGYGQGGFPFGHNAYDDYDYDDGYYKNRESGSVRTMADSKTEREKLVLDSIIELDMAVQDDDVTLDGYNRQWLEIMNGDRSGIAMNKARNHTFTQNNGGYDHTGLFYIRFEEYSHLSRSYKKLPHPTFWDPIFRGNAVFHGLHEETEYPETHCGDSACIRCMYRFNKKDLVRLIKDKNGDEKDDNKEMANAIAQIPMWDGPIYYCGVCSHWFGEWTNGVRCGDRCPDCSAKAIDTIDENDQVLREVMS